MTMCGSPVPCMAAGGVDATGTAGLPPLASQNRGSPGTPVYHPSEPKPGWPGTPVWRGCERASLGGYKAPTHFARFNVRAEARTLPTRSFSQPVETGSTWMAHSVLTASVESLRQNRAQRAWHGVPPGPGIRPLHRGRPYRLLRSGEPESLFVAPRFVLPA